MIAVSSDRLGNRLGNRRIGHALTSLVDDLKRGPDSLTTPLSFPNAFFQVITLPRLFRCKVPIRSNVTCPSLEYKDFSLSRDSEKSLLTLERDLRSLEKYRLTYRVVTLPIAPLHCAGRLQMHPESLCAEPTSLVARWWSRPSRRNRAAPEEPTKSPATVTFQGVPFNGADPQRSGGSY